jgi:hypothetical protein
MDDPKQPVKELYELIAYYSDMLQDMEKHPTWEETNVAGAEPFYRGVRITYELVIRNLTERIEIWES